MATAGPNSPAAGASVNDSAGSAWSNTSNVVSSNDTVATVVPNAGGTDLLAATDFGFAIGGSDTINGITIEVEAAESGGDGFIVEVYATKDGTTAAGSDQAGTQALTTTDTYYSFGGIADLHDTTWTPAEINASTFGALVRGGAGARINVDHIRVTVTYTAGAGIAPIQHQYRLRRVV